MVVKQCETVYTQLYRRVCRNVDSPRYLIWLAGLRWKFWKPVVMLVELVALHVELVVMHIDLVALLVGLVE
jgi:hypothetical protein